MGRAGPEPRVRLAELLGVLALGTDLGMNQPMGHAPRQSVLAPRIGDRLGLDADDRAVLYIADHGIPLMISDSERWSPFERQRFPGA